MTSQVCNFWYAENGDHYTVVILFVLDLHGVDWESNLGETVNGSYKKLVSPSLHMCLPFCHFVYVMI